MCGTSCGSSTPTAPSSGAGQPKITISSTALLFSAQDIGTTSSAQTVTLRNTGSGTVGFSSIAASTEFAATNTCNGSLIVAATCAVTVTFTPAGMGTRTGLLTITDNASDSPQVIPLAGVGGVSQFSMSPASLSFSDVILGTGTNQTVTLTNNGTTAVSITSISTTGDYSQTNNCGTTLPATNSCTISVRFTPTDVGVRVGTLAIGDNAPGNPHSASLTGSGLAVTRAIFLLQPTLTFPGQAVGSTSKATTAQFTNAGITPVTISGISANGDFAQTNSCASSLVPNAVCTLNVTFTPTAAGTRTGTITIATDASSGNSTIALTGTGTDSSSGSGPLVALAPGALTFPNQVVGSASAAQAVTVSNTGGATLSITGVSTTDDFTETSGCGSPVPAGGSCAIMVTFRPGSAGTHAGSLLISDSAPGSPHAVSLTGKGTASSGTAATVALSPSGLVFGALLPGVASDPQSVTVTNTGKSQLNISSIVVEGDFSESDTCGYSIGAGASCAVTIVFKPTATGTRAGRVTIADDATNNPQVITLSGTGGTGLVSLSPTNLNLGTQAVGTASASQSVTVSNTGAIPVNILSITAAGDFSQTNTCTDPLASGGGNCIVTVTFTPTATGTRTGSVTIVHDAPGSPQTIVLTGVGGSL